MVAAAASKRRRISIFSRTFSTHCGRNVEGFRLAVNQHGDLKLGVKVLAVGAMAVGPAAGAFAFDKRAGQHFAERTEAADEFAAQFQVGIAGWFHMTLIIVSEIQQSQAPAKICKNAVNRDSEWKPLQTNELALGPCPYLTECLSVACRGNGLADPPARTKHSAKRCVLLE